MNQNQSFGLGVAGIVPVIFCIVMATTIVVQAEELDLSPFLQHIKFTNDGIHDFFGRYNHPLYTKHVLPACSLNEIDLLSYAKDQKDPYDYAYTIIGLFHQRFKACTWKNPFALNEFLEALPRLIGFLFENKTNVQESLRSYLWESVYNPRGLFIRPARMKAFIEKLYEGINEQVLKPAISICDTQQLLVRFLESMLDKIIWDMHDAADAWESLKTTINNLKLLLEYRIIPDNDTFNQLLWSLTYRFSLHLEKDGLLIPLELYSLMQEEIAQGKLLPLHMPEKEQLIQSKMKTLIHALHVGQAAALAYKKGIIKLSSY